jgi:hypothetical protein
MVEELTPDYIRPGLHFDAGPLGLDLYRLLCLYLADRRVMSLALDDRDSIRALHDSHIDVEVLRILISSAVTLRIALDQYSGIAFGPKSIKGTCGLLWPNWPEHKNEPLTIREACNKIIHATKIQRDIANLSPDGNPDNPDAHVLPNVYLYGERGGQGWRAKLSIIDFVKRGANVWMAIVR